VNSSRKNIFVYFAWREGESVKVELLSARRRSAECRAVAGGIRKQSEAGWVDILTGSLSM